MQIGDGIPEALQQKGNERVQLADGLHPPAGKAANGGVPVFLSRLGSGDGSGNKGGVYCHAPVIYFLVKMPFFPDRWSDHLIGQRLIYRPHGLDIQPAIFPEAIPLGRVRIAVGNLPVRAALAKKINQLAAILVLGFIRRNPTDPAKIKQSPGQSQRPGGDHRVPPSGYITGGGFAAGITGQNIPVKI